MRDKDPSRHKVPSKSTIRRAASTLSKARKRRVRVRRHYIGLRPLSPKQLAFRTWQHDFNTVLDASAKALGDRPARDVIAEVEHAVEMMHAAIDRRRPGGAQTPQFFRRRPMPTWRLWQNMFDRLVHHLSERLDLAATDIVVRAERIADEAMKVIEKRRPGRRVNRTLRAVA